MCRRCAREGKSVTLLSLIIVDIALFLLHSRSFQRAQMRIILLSWVISYARSRRRTGLNEKQPRQQLPYHHHSGPWCHRDCSACRTATMRWMGACGCWLELMLVLQCSIFCRSFIPIAEARSGLLSLFERQLKSVPRAQNSDSACLGPSCFLNDVCLEHSFMEICIFTWNIKAALGDKECFLILTGFCSCKPVVVDLSGFWYFRVVFLWSGYDS